MYRVPYRRYKREAECLYTDVDQCKNADILRSRVEGVRAICSQSDKAKVHKDIVNYTRREPATYLFHVVMLVQG